MKFCFALLVLILGSMQSLASGTLVGTVRDAQTKDALVGASLRIETTAFGANSKRDGSFIVRSLPSGSYSLIVSMLGYSTQKLTVVISTNDTTRIDVSLQSQSLLTTEVVVSANKRVQAVQDVPISVSVVDQRAIQQRGATKLDEVLRYVPGVVMVRDQISIRGTSGFAFGLGSRTSVFLDNIPMLPGDNGDVKFDAMPLFAVDRIEVVKGAGSALYGTGALGGVINIITKEPSEEAELRLRTTAGLFTLPRFQQWQYRNTTPFAGAIDASYSQKSGALGYLVSGGLRRDESYRSFDDSFRWNLFGKATYQPAELSWITVLSQFANEDRANWVNWQSLAKATLPPTSTDTTDRVTSQKFSLSAEYKQGVSSTDFLIVRAGFFRTFYENSFPDTSSEKLQSLGTALNTELQYNTQLHPHALLTVGANVTRNNAESVSYPAGEDISQTILSSYAQSELSFVPDLTLTVGGRIDAERIGGAFQRSQISPKLGASYKSPFGTQFRASAGRAFRAPSIAERFAAIRFSGFVVQRNVSLRPELSWSYEIGASQVIPIGTSPWNLDVALFQNDMEDLIEPTFVLNNNRSEIQFVNITQARIQGAELSLKGWVVPSLLGIESAVTLLNPINLVTNTTLQFRNNTSWINRAIIPLSPFEVQVEYRYLSRVEQIDDRLQTLGLVVNADARVPIHVLDARLIFSFEKYNTLPLTLTLNARNLLDYYYTEMSGNLAPTRYISLQADYKW